MGLLLNKSNQSIAVLRLNHSIGRSKHNKLAIPEPDVSKSHASLYWFKDDWYIKDHSSNGTLCNGELIVHESRKIKKGDILQFGKSDTTLFELIEHHLPSSYLQNSTSPENIIVLKNGTHYPSENPTVSFFRLNNYSWCIDNGVEEQHLINGKTYQFCDEDWVFVENEPLEDTVVHKEINDTLIFEFSLSHDQESIRLILSSLDTKYDLGKRVHNHLLLILAREKLKDIEAEQQANVCGWVCMDSVVKILRKELMQPNIDQYSINIMIHRVRKQLSKGLPFNTNISDLIERNNGQLRFRYNNIIIKTI